MLNGDRTEKRVKRHAITQEDFTPEWVIEHYLSPPDSNKLFTDHRVKFIDPAAGTGNIICYILLKRLKNGIPYKKAISTLYGTELMADNVNEMVTKIHHIIIEHCKKSGEKYSQKAINNILIKNIICTDAFKWDYENWKPVDDGPTLFDDDPIWNNMI